MPYFMTEDNSELGFKQGDELKYGKGELPVNFKFIAEWKEPEPKAKAKPKNK